MNVEMRKICHPSKETACVALLALSLARLPVVAIAAALEPTPLESAPTISVLLGAHYTDSGQRETHDMAVHVVQKTGSDNDNIVVVICGDGYTKDDQEKFVADARRMWAGALAYEPYRTFAHRFNVYAVSTVSKGAWGSGETFFNSSVLADGRSLVLSGNRCKNHIMERCIGPAFIRDYHDARRQEPFKDPDIVYENGQWIDENAPYYFVFDYIRVFVVLANSDKYMGGSAIDQKLGFQYVASSAGNSSIPTLAHELGHAMLHLGDEYSTGQMTDEQAARSLNISATGDPARLRWKTLLGFRGTYPVPYQYGAQSFNSSRSCTMNSLDYDFCELCRLQGAKRMATLMADGQDGLYVATPELLAVTGNYAKPADFAPATIEGYNAFATDYANRLYSGTGRSRFRPQDMAGQTLRLRTVVQNFSVTRARRVRLSFALKSAAGATLHSVEQVYDVGPWADRAKFDVGGHCLAYTGPENFDSGLANCELLYTLPSGLSADVTYAFEVRDADTGELLADDTTETTPYAPVKISYVTTSGKTLPGTGETSVLQPVGRVIDWPAPAQVGGYELARPASPVTVGAGGATRVYVYRAPGEAPFPLLPGESDAVNALVRPVADAAGVTALTVAPDSKPLEGLELFTNIPIMVTPSAPGATDGTVAVDYVFAVSDIRLVTLSGERAVVVCAKVSVAGEASADYAPMTRLDVQTSADAKTFSSVATARALTAAELGALGLSPSPGERYFRLGAAESPSATFLKVRATRTNGLL
mgnify:CR=1 FL=1